MSNLTLYRPGSLSRLLNSMWDGFDDSFYTEADKWTPRVNIVDSEKEILFTAELPGLKKEDVKVTFDNGYLHISGEKKDETEKKQEERYYYESNYGKFERRFQLPEGVKEKEIKADFRNGVLKLTIPKSEEENKVHKIDIK